MMTAMWCLTVLCALACGVLVLAEFREWELRRIAAKVTASAAFIGVAAFGVLASTKPVARLWDSYQTLVVLGLVFGALGDVALLGKSKQAFLAGLFAFLLGHLLFVGACALLVPPATWFDLAGGLVFVPAAIGIVVLVWLWPHLGPMRPAVIKYVIVIVTMVVGALALVHSAVPTPNRQLFALGAVLFFVSDLAVARDKFIAKQPVNRAWGLPCYYAGQLLIAWSVLA